MTTREMYEVIGNVFAAGNDENRDEVLAFIEKQVAAIDRKNAKAKERAAEKRADGDALRGAIEGLLTDAPKTVNDILDELGDDTLTPAKVVARMTQLVKAEKAAKETVKIEGRKLVGYIKA